MGTRAKTKGEEGIFELFLVILMPIWMPFKAIRMMMKEMAEEKRKREEGEK